jgi:hypothetical protein
MSAAWACALTSSAASDEPKIPIAATSNGAVMAQRRLGIKSEGRLSATVGAADRTAKSTKFTLYIRKNRKSGLWPVGPGRALQAGSQYQRAGLGRAGKILHFKAYGARQASAQDLQANRNGAVTWGNW